MKVTSDIDHTKPPYIKKLKEFSPFTVWEVDGAYVRSHLSNDFVCCAQHYTFSFIPRYEFWIDREMAQGESSFYISFLQKEFECRSQGMSYEKAYVLASRKEKSERFKSVKYLHAKGLDKEELLQRVHKELLQSYSNEFVKVWVVDGELVRDLFFPDFTEGGHDLVYSFIPNGEVWLDDDLGQTSDRRFVLLHELYERALMGDKGLNYDNAHEEANIVEYHCRKNSKEIDKYIQEAIDNNSKEFKPNSQS